MNLAGIHYRLFKMATSDAKFSGYCLCPLKSIPGLCVEKMGEGDPVFLLHGLGGSRQQWLFQMPVFSKKFATYAWDARGFGESASVPPVDDFSQFATDLKLVFDELGIAKAHIVGSSMGGRIALDFYEKHPNRVSSLVLYDTFPGVNAWYVPRRLIKKFLNYRQKPLREGKELSDISDQLARVITSKKTDSSLVKMVSDGLARCGKTTYLKTIGALFDYQPVAKLDKIAVPTLVVVGSDDRVTWPILARYMAWKIPNSQFCKIKKAGHVANIERADVFNEQVMMFLTRIAAPV